MPYELKAAIERLLAIADARGGDHDDNLYERLEHNSTMGEFEYAFDHFADLYESVRDRL